MSSASRVVALWEGLALTENTFPRAANPERIRTVRRTAQGTHEEGPGNARQRKRKVAVKTGEVRTPVTYRIHDVPVDGGTLRVGEWGPDDSDNTAVPTVVAVHGITASHLAWAPIAHACPQVRLIAPDLRGRGRSAGLPGPFGMARHAADLEAVVESLELPSALLVGHSMGGFVAVVAAQAYPDRFSQVLLVDGGLPLAVPEGISREDMLGATLGPAASRLSMTFPDRTAYQEF